MLSLVVALTPLSSRAIAYTSASSADSGKLAEPTTTEPDAPPPDSGLEPELAVALVLAAAELGALEELEELLEQPATAARAMAVTAAIPVAVAILGTIMVFPFGVPDISGRFYWLSLPAPRNPAGTSSLESRAKSPSTSRARITTSSAPPATGPYWVLARPSMMNRPRPPRPM